MAEFVTEDKLNAALADIFREAKKMLVIFSPYIKLHQRLVDILKSRKDDHKLQIVVVFGKNEKDVTKSLDQKDFELLKEFPAVCIKYDERLHAKVYMNDLTMLLSSMNIYDYSQNNNIEFGVLCKRSEIADVASKLTNGLIGGASALEYDAFQHFSKVEENAKTLYNKEPQFSESLGGLSKKYSHSEVTIDELTEKYQTKSKPTLKSTTEKTGYCIRTGVKIPFDIKMPFSEKAFKSWDRYKDENYKERYCHFSGEESKGDTSFAKPILKQNWKKAMK